MENFISRWKLNRENFAAIRDVLEISDAEFVERCSWLNIEELEVISDFVANNIVETIKGMLDEAETKIKALAVKLILNHCEKTMETSKNGIPIATPKLLSIDRLYQEKRSKSKWLLFYYLFDLDIKESTFVDKINNIEKRAEF